MSRFVAIPEIPQSGLKDWESSILSALKEDVELLIGSRGEGDFESLSVTRGDIRAVPISKVALLGISARGDGFNISGQDVAGLADYRLLITNFYQIAQDVQGLRNTVNFLLQNMRG